MELSREGQIAQEGWLKSCANRADKNLTFGAFVVMPNHFHAIVILEDKKRNGPSAGRQRKATPRGSLDYTPKSLVHLLRNYKTMVAENAVQLHPNFAWQEQFHVHAIRNEKSLRTISEYIRNNPQNWVKDKFYSKS